MIRLAVTPGEPAGIGPDLLIKLVQQPQPCELVAFADPDMLMARAAQLQLPLQLRPVNANKSAQPIPQPASPQLTSPQQTATGELAIYPVPLASSVQAGQPNSANARYILNTLTAAASHCKIFTTSHQSQQSIEVTDTASPNKTGVETTTANSSQRPAAPLCDAMVTGPVHKGIINEAGIPFSGHTEFLADLAQCPRVVMMLATEGLRVALATTHLPLSDVPKAITQTSLEQVIRILHNDLIHKFGIAHPRILVAGLNPHAGEDGHLGREEIDTITPVLKRLNTEGMHLTGPLPADTLFTPKYLQQCDAVLAMFHDQGLPVLKYKGFGQAVNITLGLPFIRTSVDHGTALDLAGTGQGDIGSLQTAIAYACQMAAAHTAHSQSPDSSPDTSSNHSNPNKC